MVRDGAERASSDRQRGDLLRAAEALGARSIKAGGNYFGAEFDSDRIAAELAMLGRQAADAGTRIGLEPVPFADIRTPEMALEVVQKAGNPAVGVYLDIWHVARAGFDFESLSAIPVTAIVGVELDDAAREVRGNLVEDTVNRRRFPGEGELDVQGFVDAVRRGGYAGPWGVEMLSVEYRQLPVQTAVRAAYTSAAQFLAR
ncbi:sugar phosphate isomerase/epimerase family protein [Pseudonocardia acaciae]|uniref:sugar phosphate isomerase/epimerase family protein n=1 Tax=Pseudonocardia acaciae TaxID=551276 RepID=UPI000687F706|nr:TIM barrel protein [Pseudonocardia acaciae]